MVIKMDEFVHFLNQRVSALSGFITAPAPNHQQLMTILQAGMSAPDHGGLMPWRFKIYNHNNFNELQDIAITAKRHENPDIGDDEMQKTIGKLRRAPLVVAVWAQKQNQKNIPMAEQVAAVNMAVAQQLLCASAMGFAAVYLTGWLAFSPIFHQHLGMGEQDEFCGFLYLGSFAQNPPAKTRPRVEQFITNILNIQ